MYDIFTLLNDLIFEVGRLILIAAAMFGGIKLGKFLRDKKDNKITTKKADNQ